MFEALVVAFGKAEQSMVQTEADEFQIKLVWQLQLVLDAELVAFGILLQLILHP